MSHVGIFKKLLGNVPKIVVTTQSVDLNAIMAMATGAQPASDGPQFIKKTTCHNCGGAKKLAPKTAYVYCDFCGSLTDYDFQKACETPRAHMPGPAYEALLRETQADTMAARQEQDQGRFLEIQSRLFSRWVELCPNAVSPRAKSDDGYRSRLVDYMAQTATLNEFDPTYQGYAGRVAEQTAAIRWNGVPPQVTAVPEAFLPLYETVRKQIDHSYTLLKPAGVLELHPDGAPERLQRRMTWSMFCQGWLPYLAPAESEHILADTGLKGEYSVLEPVDSEDRHCGKCGGDLHKLPGARSIVCEDCGTVVDLENPEVNCQNCAGAISFPVGQNRVQCPYCRAEAQRMAH